ncbi:CYP4V2 [Acanthosepion pharaonis]|uniref:CYP4V2 n=1 Tax=Acanthosepion pharaonis TaxID=158019 RepID=A0A812EX85_ACAPH|nr:CYP4V2 [Sepia pharaonis]
MVAIWSSYKVIENRQKEYNENEAMIMEEEADDADESNVYMKKKRRTFLDTLLYNWHRGKLTTEEIQEEVDTFMFEGHDTTSVGMMWALYMIVSHPEVYKKVNKEIDDVFAFEADETESKSHVYLYSKYTNNLFFFSFFFCLFHSLTFKAVRFPSVYFFSNAVRRLILTPVIDLTDHPLLTHFQFKKPFETF